MAHGTEKETDIAEEEEDVDEDDLCPICRLLLYDPVITACRHTLCKSCMAQWADCSLSAPMTIVHVDEQASDFDAATGLEARCPMCRTQTSATLDNARSSTLGSKYPQTYAERRAEETDNNDDTTARDSIQTITVYIGNRHELVEPSADRNANMHQWTFFVRPSRTDIIEEVQIFLHPTFRPSHIIRSRPPYSIQRLGWGTFNITAGVILKAGYSWVSTDAENSPDGAANGMLRLEWMLDFTAFGGTGAMGRCRLKVKNDRSWEGVSEEEERDEVERERGARQYRRDGRYEPPDG